MTPTIGPMVLMSSGGSSREPNGICDACGRRGTVARATLETEPRQLLRWCARCAPREVRRFEQAREDEDQRWYDHVRSHAMQSPGRPPDLPAPPGRTVTWDTWRGRAYFLWSMVRLMLTRRNREFTVVGRIERP